MSSSPYLICGPYGQKLYPSPNDRPGKYRRVPPLDRNIKRSISQYDHAEKVTICAQIAARIPALRGAIKQKNEWAFPPESWHPIFYGEHNDNEVWEDAATNWLVHDVFPNALRRNTRKDLLRAICVSGMDVDRHGRDLALFSVVDKMPKMTVIPGTCIGNGPRAGAGGAGQTLQGGASYDLDGSGYARCVGGEFDGYRIYQGIIHDDEDEPIAARVLGFKRKVGGASRTGQGSGDWEETFVDVRLGFAYGAHLWSEYDWHGMGAPLPSMAGAILKWMRKEEIDDLLLTGLANAAGQTVIHQLAEGEDAPMALGDGMQMIETTDSNGDKQTIYVQSIGDGSTKYIGSKENLTGLQYANPHPNVQEFSRGNLVECLVDYGWPYSFLDSSDGGRAATRLDCELANNSIWQKQSPGQERMFWFLKFSIGVGLAHRHIPAPPAGLFDMPYRWTFGLPKEISVDAGNDVTASLSRLRHGLTSQRIESGRWGYVQKRIDKDRQKESFKLIDHAVAMMEYAKKKGVDLPFQTAKEFFYSPSPNAQALPQQQDKAESGNQKTESGQPAKAEPKPAKQ